MLGSWFGNDKTHHTVMRSAHKVNALGHTCLSFELAKTCENKEGVREASNPGSKKVVSFCWKEVYSLSFSSNAQLPSVD